MSTAAIRNSIGNYFETRRLSASRSIGNKTSVRQACMDPRIRRSALGWVIDQYRMKRDEKGQITSDPNRAEDPEYILRPVAQVITVSLETQRLVASLPAIDFGLAWDGII